MERDEKARRRGLFALLSWILPVANAAVSVGVALIPGLGFGPLPYLLVIGAAVTLVGLGFGVYGLSSERKASAVVGLVLNLGLAIGAALLLHGVGQGFAAALVPR